MNLAATVQDGIAHGLNDPGQLVRADVRMRVYQDVRRGSVLAKHPQNLLHVAPLLAARVELPVRVGAGSAFAETVVRLRVHCLRARYLRQVALAAAHILAPFYHYRAQA